MSDLHRGGGLFASVLRLLGTQGAQEPNYAYGRIQNISGSMAGAVRQPIDICSLSTYLENNVPEVQLPISIKQV